MSGIVHLVIQPKKATKKRIRFNKIPVRTFEQLTFRQIAAVRFIYGGVKFNADALQLYNKRLKTYKELYAGTCRAVGNLMWELPKIETGLASVSWNAISNSQERLKQGTGDHIVTRQVGGQKVLNAYYKGKIKTPEELWSFIFSNRLTHVHKILRTENIALGRLKKPQYIKWQDGYARLGIIVEKIRELPRKKRTSNVH